MIALQSAAASKALRFWSKLRRPADFSEVCLPEASRSASAMRVRSGWCRSLAILARVSWAAMDEMTVVGMSSGKWIGGGLSGGAVPPEGCPSLGERLAVGDGPSGGCGGAGAGGGCGVSGRILLAFGGFDWEMVG